MKRENNLTFLWLRVNYYSAASIEKMVKISKIKEISVNIKRYAHRGGFSSETINRIASTESTSCPAEMTVVEYDEW